MFIRLEDSRYSTGWILPTNEGGQRRATLLRPSNEKGVRSFVLFFPDLDHGPGRV